MGSRAKNVGKGSKFLDSVKEKSIIKESDTVELKGIQVFSAQKDKNDIDSHGKVMTDNFISNESSILMKKSKLVEQSQEKEKEQIEIEDKEPCQFINQN